MYVKISDKFQFYPPARPPGKTGLQPVQWKLLGGDCQSVKKKIPVSIKKQVIRKVEAMMQFMKACWKNH
jgi:hypothetical protein